MSRRDIPTDLRDRTAYIALRSDGIDVTAVMDGPRFTGEIDITLPTLVGHLHDWDNNLLTSVPYLSIRLRLSEFGELYAQLGRERARIKESHQA